MTGSDSRSQEESPTRVKAWRVRAMVLIALFIAVGAILAPLLAGGRSAQDAARSAAPAQVPARVPAQVPAGVPAQVPAGVPAQVPGLHVHGNQIVNASGKAVRL